MHVTNQAPPSIEDMTFAELEQLRENLGISRERLCGKAEISPSTYKRWQHFLKGDGRGSCPRVVSLNAVRDVLRVECARSPASAARRTPRSLA